MFTYISHSPSQTNELAQKIGQVIPAGAVLALTGELAAGKTTFCQGLAKGMGICDAVTSPTFVLLQTYQGRIPLCHIDAYRLTEDAIDETGLEDCFDGRSVVAVEWPQAIHELLPDDAVQIRFSYYYGEGEQDHTETEPSTRRIDFDFKPGICVWLEEVIKCLSSV